jgi:hypothetical protein
VAEAGLRVDDPFSDQSGSHTSHPLPGYGENDQDDEDGPMCESSQPCSVANSSSDFKLGMSPAKS